MQTKYILHGGYTRQENELNYSFFRELTKDVPEGGMVLMCFFASGDEDKTDTYEELCQKIVRYSSKQLRFNFAVGETFIEDIRSSDAVYFHGGSTRTLLKALEQFPDLKTLLQGKTVAGSSAGAYMLAAYGAAHNEDCAREGLGFVNKKVVCHYQSADMPPTDKSFEELAAIAPELETVFLRDCEWKVVAE